MRIWHSSKLIDRHCTCRSVIGPARSQQFSWQEETNSFITHFVDEYYDAIRLNTSKVQQIEREGLGSDCHPRRSRFQSFFFSSSWYDNKEGSMIVCAWDGEAEEDGHHCNVLSPYSYSFWPYYQSVIDVVSSTGYCCFGIATEKEREKRRRWWMANWLIVRNQQRRRHPKNTITMYPYIVDLQFFCDW